jgi:hypothetical protein
LRKLLVAREAVTDFRLITEPLRSEVVARLKLLTRFPNIGRFVPSEIPQCARPPSAFFASSTASPHVVSK